MQNGDLLQIKQLFDEVYDLTPQERLRFLASHYAPDTEPRRTLERLLQRESEIDVFLATPLFEELSLHFQQETATLSLSHLGPYRLERELGRGGMGVVYLAVRDDDVFRKQVAIKLVWPGLSQMAERFRQERQILADLEHPHIARLLDGGATSEGWQYLVMEYVEGIPLTDYCQQKKLSVSARLQLFLHICDAVQHAHQHLIIHRDLKPGNILVTSEGQVKLLDFGIAKALDSHVNHADISLPGTHLMTPEYASPEQLRGESVTTASDAYSLGVVLYELLTGQRPFHFSSRQPHAVANLISQQEPPRLSQIVGRQAAKQLRGDLDNIVARALQQQPQDRYGSVAQFAEDIRRHLNGEVVIARKPTLAYRAHRFVRRHRAAFSAGAIIALILSLWLASFVRQVRQERVQAQAQRRQLYAAEMRQAQEAWKNNDLVQMRKTLEHWLPQTGEEDLRGFEWGYLQRLINASVQTIPLPAVPISLDVQQNAPYFVVKLVTGEIKLFDTRTGQEIRSFPAPVNKDEEVKVCSCGDVVRLIGQRKIIVSDLLTGAQKAEYIEPEGNLQSYDYYDKHGLLTLATDGTIKLRDSGTGAVLRTIPGRGKLPTWYYLLRDHAKLLTVWDERSVRIDFLHQDRPPLEFSDLAVLRVLQSDFDSQHLITLTDEALTVRNLATGHVVARLPQRTPAFVMLGLILDRRLLATGSADGTIELWTLPALQQVASLRGHTRDVVWLSMRGGLADLLSTSLDRTVRLWDLQTKQEKAVLRGHTGNLVAWDFDPQTKQLLTASQDRTVRIWDLQEVGKPALLTGHTDHILTVAYSPDSRHIASAGKDRTIILHNADTGTQRVLSGHQKLIYTVRFSPNGQWLASCSDDGTVKLWEVATGRELQSFFNSKREYWGSVRSLAFLPDGQMLVLGGNDGTIQLWNLATNQVSVHFKAHTREILSLSLSPDGKRLVSGGWNDGFKLWDTTTWQQIAANNDHHDKVWSAVFSPDGQQLATGSGDQTIKLWDVATLQLQRTLTGHNNGIFQVAFTPDGKRLASVSDDQTVKIWNPHTGQELLTLRDHTNEVWGVAFAPDGKTMVTGSWDKTLRLWRAVNSKR